MITAIGKCGTSLCQVSDCLHRVSADRWLTSTSICAFGSSYSVLLKLEANELDSFLSSFVQGKRYVVNQLGCHSSIVLSDCSCAHSVLTSNANVSVGVLLQRRGNPPSPLSSTQSNK